VTAVLAAGVLPTPSGGGASVGDRTAALLAMLRESERARRSISLRCEAAGARQIGIYRMRHSMWPRRRTKPSSSVATATHYRCAAPPEKTCDLARVAISQRDGR
jgi:hypothetical protein